MELMRTRPVELIAALIAIILITVLYVFAARNGVPSPGSGFGHALGVIGFLLMLFTETFYSLRKRSRWFLYGPTSTWLQIHIFTGIVGPFLVLLHSAGKLNGLAGLLTFLTVLIVLSGFLGRYLYTATPRTLEGVEVGLVDLRKRIAETVHQLRSGAGPLAQAARGFLEEDFQTSGWVVVLARPWLRWRRRRRVHAALAGLRTTARAQVRQVEFLLDQHYALILQVQALGATRRIMALWHIVHVPLGGVVFTLAFIHVFAALYYSTFMR
jgi:hypothetical protein